MRFLGIMQHIMQVLSSGTLGTLYFARIEAGQFLPLWRKGRDYRDSYSASSERGGGVALDLSHELDYMRYLFGNPASWKVMKSRAGCLEIDAEDTFEGIYLYDNGFICSTHMDCLQANARRYLRVEGSKGHLECDFVGKTLTVDTDSGRHMINEKALFDIDRTYIDELERFLDAIENASAPEVSIDDGSEVLRLVKDSHK